ncbi:hypothetical protein ANOM_006706 [Aspergillus nomiae NRRL 13137]|uniref:Zn(2)-C6 fungal-type domain-containing protein n=1 Tax=Aspergillus nomiae NRRL (strain ATCC 15546 / NRRL 13137 / CBS 260.88 / M93) TaxID=1509407 RepID=A0A0L1J047_ASPN3|nr:uncharacterized protein ANOM_006706 [Aspergillus nomiae NRRL 13137]KNG84788.1 hypothetical protein ANOM_006706 [Aspergillus nomiae NRRL 13137]
MARIAGGSKGCHACRRRKKRCDEQRPSCGQCLSRNTSCPGYAREMKFINVSYQDKCRSSQAAPESSSTTEVSSDSREVDTRSDLVATHRVCSSGLSSHALSLQRSAVAYYCGAYFHNNVIQTGLDVFGKSSYIDWMAFTPDLDVDEPSLKSALLALGAARMGHLSQDPRLTRLSSESYSQSLRQLRRSIQNGTRGLRDENLAKGSSTRGLGWASHTYGALSLVHSQGLDTEWSPARRRLFDGLRLSAMIHCIGTRKPTYLATPEWTSLPWKGYKKEPKQYLLDLMMEIPALLQTIDSVHNASDLPGNLQKLSTVCKEYLKLSARLRAWYEAYKSDYPSKLYWEQPAKFHSSHALPQEKFPPTSMYFSDFETGHIHLLYWTSHVLLCSNLGMLYLSCLTKAAEGSRPPFPPFPCDTQEMHGMAVNIAKSAEYFLQPKTIALGAGVISFPVSIAFGYLDYYNLPERDWFYQIFEYTKMFGIDVGAFLEAVPAETKLHLVAC